MPRQSVNFCRQQARRLLGTAPFNLAWTGVAAALCSVWLGAISLYGESSQHRQAALLAEAERALAKQAAAVAALHRRPPEPAADPALTAEMEQLAQHAESLRSLLSRMEGGDLARHAGFSGYFEALAKHVLPEVYITGIRLYERGQEIELTGTTSAAEQVPRLAQALGQEAVFAAKHFAELRMHRPDAPADQVDFVLRTTLQASDRERH